MHNRFIIKENEMVSAKNTINCVDCKYRDKSNNGFKKCICEKFNDMETNYKPDEILFDGRNCKFYEKDSN